jgi:hypothetical protein
MEGGMTTVSVSVVEGALATHVVIDIDGVTQVIERRMFDDIIKMYRTLAPAVSQSTPQAAEFQA